MKNILRLGALAGLFFGLLAPLPVSAQTVIKILFVFTQDGANTAASRGDSLKRFAERAIEHTNRRLADSGATFSVASVGEYGPSLFSPNARSISDTTPYIGSSIPGPFDIGAVKMAIANTAVNTARNGAFADVVVVVADYVSLGGDRGGMSPICPSAANAYVGISASAQYEWEDVLAHELGHTLCATHEMGTVLNFGGYPDNCMQRYDVMGGEKPFVIPTVSWFAPGVMANVAPGHGGSADAAFGDMTSHCPATSTPAYDYACFTVGGCQLNVSLDAATCYYYTTQKAKFFPFEVTQSGVQAAGVNKVLSAGQCLNKVQAGKFSKNGGTYQGQPFGDATHDAMGVMNSRAPTVAGFR